MRPLPGVQRQLELPVKDIVLSDFSRDQIHHSKPVQPRELPKLNQSLTAYIAVRPERRPENYASALERK